MEKNRLQCYRVCPFPEYTQKEAAMRKLRSFLRRVRIKYRRSSTLTKAVVICTIVVCMVALLVIGWRIDSVIADYEAKRDLAAQLEQENDKLGENIDNLGSADSIEQIAKDELGMVPSDAVVITPDE